MIDGQSAGHGPADAVAPIHSVRAEAVCQQVQEGDPQQDHRGHHVHHGIQAVARAPHGGVQYEQNGKQHVGRHHTLQIPGAGGDDRRGAISKLGCKYVLIKGGHFQGTEKIDYLFEDGKPITSFRGISINTRNTHGTGCTLSSAITSYLAREMDMNTAIAMAKTYLSGAILAGKDVQIGKGHGPVNHFYEPKALFIK